VTTKPVTSAHVSPCPQNPRTRRRPLLAGSQEEPCRQEHRTLQQRNVLVNSALSAPFLAGRPLLSQLDSPHRCNQIGGCIFWAGADAGRRHREARARPRRPHRARPAAATAVRRWAARGRGRGGLINQNCSAIAGCRKRRVRIGSSGGSSAAVATSREGDRSPTSVREGRRPISHCSG
jgi:hypothetical protein